MKPTPDQRTALLQFIRVLSLCGTVLLLWYLLVIPALDLDEKVKPPKVADISQAQKDLAKFDLEKKVYPEIQARILETNEWLFRKFTLAGGLVTGFLLQVWLRLWRKKPGEHTQRAVETVLSDFLRSPATSAVLGLACMVSLFIDLHVRSSIQSIQQLGLWAATYADVAVGGDPNGFPGWEQFIRMKQSNASGMHQSLTNALQAGNLAVVTIIIFVFYHWTFQEVCLRRLDQLNRLISWLLIGMLCLLFVGSHLSSGNVTMVAYEGPVGFIFSSRVCYLVALLVLSTVTVLWHLISRVARKAPNHAMQLTGSSRHGSSLQTRRLTDRRHAALRL